LLASGKLDSDFAIARMYAPVVDAAVATTHWRITDRRRGWAARHTTATDAIRAVVIDDVQALVDGQQI
jgi:hypothetical protein